MCEFYFSDLLNHLMTANDWCKVVRINSLTKSTLARSTNHANIHQTYKSKFSTKTS